jgi:putative membrane protein insertion efficiency factor
VLRKLLIKIICLYRKYKPKKWNGACIYSPTCSEYMIIALQKYGVRKGLRKGVLRIKRCNETSIGGFDQP